MHHIHRPYLDPQKGQKGVPKGPKSVISGSDPEIRRVGSRDPEVGSRDPDHADHLGPPKISDFGGLTEMSTLWRFCGNPQMVHSCHNPHMECPVIAHVAFTMYIHVHTKHTIVCRYTQRSKSAKVGPSRIHGFEGSVLTTEFGGIHDGLGNCNPNA